MGRKELLLTIHSLSDIKPPIGRRWKTSLRVLIIQPDIMYSEEECLLSHLMADAAHQSAITNQIVNFTEYYEAKR